MKEIYKVSLITTQKELRRLFREFNPDLDFKRIKDHSGKGLMYKCDTRCAFNVWIDGLNRGGVISQNLACRVTL